MKKSPRSSKAKEPSAAPVASPQKGQDVVLVHGVTEDRKGLLVVRARDGGIEVGALSPLTEGQPIHGDVVKLHPRKETPLICDVETTFSLKSASEGSDRPASKESKSEVRAEAQHPRVGPPKVATRAYRENWDQIWSGRASTRGSSDLN